MEEITEQELSDLKEIATHVRYLVDNLKGFSDYCIDEDYRRWDEIKEVIKRLPEYKKVYK